MISSVDSVKSKVRTACVVGYHLLGKGWRWAGVCEIGTHICVCRILLEKLKLSLGEELRDVGQGQKKMNLV